MKILKHILRASAFKRIALISAILLTILLILFLVFRNTILHSILEKKTNSFRAKYNAEIVIGDSRFSGFTGIVFENITLVPDNGDTLLNCRKLYVHLKLLPLLIGSVKIDDVSLENTVISVVQKHGKNNYSFLLRSEKDKITKTNENTNNYADHLNKIFTGIFDKIPDNIEIHMFEIKALLDSNLFSLTMPGFSIEDHEFLTALNVNDNGSRSLCFLSGEIIKSKQSVRFCIYANSGQKVHLPFVKSGYGLRCDFDTLSAGFYINGDDKKIDFVGKAAISGLLLNHKKIAAGDVAFEKLAIDFNIHANESFIELDSSSAITYNRFIFNPYIRLSQKPKLKINIKINNEFVAQDLFESLPNGLFSNFEGIKTKGKLRLNVFFELNMQQPDSLKFKASLTGNKFSVVKWGITDFRKINGTFNYSVYDGENAIRTFAVGPENPDYVSLDQISNYLKEAVLISENGGFFWSDGFNVEAFRQSIIQNIREGRFVRGGSTIDMQLVKNVFLTRNKTIARKAEEILIVWLINSLNLCSKEKMYEVYLNLIEWGPGIYGVTEASQYYFKKKPSKLNLPESIFLASIIPKPRWFKYSFNENGKLLEQNQAYFSLIAQKLIEKESAVPQDTFEMLKRVKLKGLSKQFLAKDTKHFNLDSLRIKSDD